jgi:hypothetical protein
VLTHACFGNVYKALSWPRTKSNLKLLFSLLLSLPHSKSLNSPLPHTLLVASQSQSHLSRIYREPNITLQGQRPSVVTVPHSLASEAFRRHCCLRPGASCQCSSAFFDYSSRTEAFRRHCSFTHSHQRPSVVTVAYGQEHLVSALVHSSTTLRPEAFRRLCCLFFTTRGLPPSLLLLSTARNS